MFPQVKNLASHPKELVILFRILRVFKRVKSWWNGLMKREPEMFAH
jgi:hypothetical protein